MMRCLWLARTMPFPQTSGDRIYTANVATALANTGVLIRFVGLAGDTPPEQINGIEWQVVSGKAKRIWHSLLSLKPLVGARFATAPYRASVAQLAKEHKWDVVVIDQYAMGWVLSMRHVFHHHPPAFVFFTHDHEESVTLRQLKASNIGVFNRLFLLQNYLKTRWSERATARMSDLLTTVTEEDRQLFQSMAPTVPMLALLPGYSRLHNAPIRRLEQSVPRRVVLFGSYKWSVKQENLRLFMEHAGCRITNANIEVHIVGDMTEEFKVEMESRYKTATFTGFVSNPDRYLNARIAIVAEPIGGGFKLKFLDYIFRGLPIAALDVCTSGLPQAVRAGILTYPDLAALAEGVIQVIDDTDLLDTIQRKTYEAARELFNWEDRGRDFNQAIKAVSRPSPLSSV